MSAPVPLTSVVIPTFNGGKLLINTFAAVLGQQLQAPFDIIVIDSGSTDGTVEMVEKAIRSPLANVRIILKKIEKQVFRHGAARNLGASLSNSTYIAFITQDACPANEHWLAALVAPMTANSNVAGVFGRHLPYPDAHPLTKRDLNAFFDGFRSDPILRLEDWHRYNTDVQYRQRLHFYSDNNSCMRRSVWRQIPYPDVKWGEDQLWARRILEHGYFKAYADDAQVYHSHDFGFREALRRGRDEMGFWEEFFSYDGVRDLKTVLRYSWLFSAHDFKWHASVPLQIGGPLSLRGRLRIFERQLARFLGEYQGRKTVRRSQQHAIHRATWTSGTQLSRRAQQERVSKLKERVNHERCIN